MRSLLKYHGYLNQTVIPFFLFLLHASGEVSESKFSLSTMQVPGDQDIWVGDRHFSRRAFSLTWNCNFLLNPRGTVTQCVHTQKRFPNDYRNVVSLT